MLHKHFFVEFQRKPWLEFHEKSLRDKQSVDSLCIQDFV
mgnify:FL=1